MDIQNFQKQVVRLLRHHLKKTKTLHLKNIRQIAREALRLCRSHKDRREAEGAHEKFLNHAKKKK